MHHHPPTPTPEEQEVRKRGWRSHFSLLRWVFSRKREKFRIREMKLSARMIWFLFQGAVSVLRGIMGNGGELSLDGQANLKTGWAGVPGQRRHGTIKCVSAKCRCRSH